MATCYTRVPTRRATALSLLCLGLTVAGACLSGCAAARGGTTFGASFPECIDPSRRLPFSDTYPCNLWNRGSFGF